MSRIENASPAASTVPHVETIRTVRQGMEKLRNERLFGVDAEALPFSPGDTTAGSETELQALVVGKGDDVDLPVTIRRSHYFANILRRRAAGELPERSGTELERCLTENEEGIWENSWVRFPLDQLGPLARRTLEGDMLADKHDPSQGIRTDASRFRTMEDGRELLRVPISYLLKLALADATEGQLPLVAETGRTLMDHFLSDNTSPEICSFHVSTAGKAGLGREVARESAKRYLLTQLLLLYANDRFGLAAKGQKAMAFYSPHPPVRQKRLNTCISDAFYRELFMNPCLSGWNRGEGKQEYMHLCHRVLSRSQLNAVGKLRDAGIITRNLVVLPNTSNISLANNGTHVSLGSRRLTAVQQEPRTGFTASHEKYLGDLALKINEHFLPLFVGTYSAAPYRLDYGEFHPESVLGFLPHELDYTHLRMLWRRWRKKADINVFGKTVTPFGPPWIDRLISSLFRLRGDFLPDFRLIDYLVALRSTETSPALDGTLHNHDRLKRDLAELGVFDSRMSLYLFNKLREFRSMGFSGFEGRIYSLFPSFGADMARAVDLQNLLTALAFQYMAEDRITHADIPDDPFVESERRQIIFGRAVGIPTFFVRQDTGNRFLRRIVEKTRKVRPSRRYPGYLRVHHREYCLSLIRIIREDAAELIESLHLSETMSDLEKRIEEPERHSAMANLTRGILDRAKSSSPMSLRAFDFNRAAEDFYREDLRRLHMREGLDFLEADLKEVAKESCEERQVLRTLIKSAPEEQDFSVIIRNAGRLITEDKASGEFVRKLIALLIVTVAFDRRRAEEAFRQDPDRSLLSASA